MKAALQNYQARMRRVLDHIDRHLDGDLDLETVSGVAAFSKFHFHRQFTATFGLSERQKQTVRRMASRRFVSCGDPQPEQIESEIEAIPGTRAASAYRYM